MNSHVWLFGTPWTIAQQAPLSMEFSRQKILKWVAISFSRESSWPRDRTWVSHIAGRFLTVWATREVAKSQPSSSIHGIPQAKIWSGCHFLLLGIFLTQGLNPCLLNLLHWQADSLPTEPPGKPLHLLQGPVYLKNSSYKVCRRLKISNGRFIEKTFVL